MWEDKERKKRGAGTDGRVKDRDPVASKMSSVCRRRETRTCQPHTRTLSDTHTWLLTCIFSKLCTD